MIPSVVAEQIRLGIEDYLVATFPPESSSFRNLWRDFFQSERGLFKGPYFDLKFPFRQGEGNLDYFQSGIELDFPPYRHQEEAFRRLCSDEPRPTIVATGTGSGKTECFLYPVLDHCWRMRGQKGVKAIVIYPMNALATDQARRFAKEIYKREQLRGNVSVGLFIGGEGSERLMTEKSVITDKNTIRATPPDVLLTNYKALDLLLTRAQDYRLWRFNEPGVLRFVVVDELHTFDGAQGTDLACLLRRLYARLGATPESVRRVGTSATLGDSPEAREKLLKFASDVFGGTFENESIITENTLGAQDFLQRGNDAWISNRFEPGEQDVEELDFERCASKEEYVDRQTRLWFGEEFAFKERSVEERVALGKALFGLRFFRNLLKIVGETPVDVEEFSRRFATYEPRFLKTDARYRKLLFISIFALISEARTELTKRDGSRAIAPFLRARCQVWMRETKRLVASVEETPRLTFKSDVSAEDRKQYLPLIHCRSCGQVGFLSVFSTKGYRLRRGLDEIYREYFNNEDSGSVYVYPANDSRDSASRFQQYLCEECLTLTYGEEVKFCSNCKSDKLLRVDVYKALEGGHKCPFCEAEELSLVGAQAASLTSVALGRIFASDYNEDKKLLAFSDSVQDASHRAGFFEGRTYRFNLRTAIQRLVESFDKPTSLADLPDLFVAYWLKRFNGSKARFVAQFIAPDLQNRDYDELRDQGEKLERQKLDRLFERVAKRVGWEIYSEYGFLSLIGRTLEKSCRSIAALDAEKRERWIDDVWKTLREKIGELRDVERGVVGTFLLGFARNLRTRGGVCADCLNEYMQDGNSWKLNDRFDFLKKFHSSRAPIFVQTESRVAERFDIIPGAKGRPSIYRKQLIRSFGRSVEGYCADVYDVALTSGEALGILQSVFGFSRGRRGRVWGLNPSALFIETTVDRLACDETNRKISTPRSERAYWLDAPDVRSESGSFALAQDASARNFYGNMYRNSDVCRVIAREHTSLLERTKREKLEEDFKKGDGEGRVGAPNALSCTPTLEMGVDVGDLSCVALCSIPPTSSNFVQRVGRAGRRDGNAVNFIVANNRPHDLYFYNEPEEMFAGVVDPPGVFLNAPAVLERQLTAYCFDRWIVDVEGDKGAVPSKLGGVLDAWATKNPSRFPKKFIDFIGRRRDELFQGFLSIFPGTLDADTIEALRKFFYEDASEGSLDRKISARLEKTRLLREDYKRRAVNARKRLQRQLTLPSDATTQKIIGALRTETAALGAALRAINQKDAYNYFTDEGLLPNYAFPETGVSLRSILYWDKVNKDGKARKPLTDEYERPASAAISEFAPGNNFFVDGRKLPINRIDVSSDFQLETWRFCGACSHVEKVGLNDVSSSVCPKCGSTTWSDGALTRKVLRLERVIASHPEKITRSFDEKDERDPKFFSRATTVEFPKGVADKAYRVEDADFPFGFDYWRGATFREINFGEYKSQEEEMEIAGVKEPTHGFRVCVECGATQIGNKDPEHSPSCKYYRAANQEKGTVDCVYLYREFRSEAIRILAPFDDAEFSTKIESFVAALYMSLKAKFGGGVDNLKITEQSEPIAGSAARKRFLVLYDVIPGGSGYLKQLASTGDALFDALEKARDKIRRCVCQNDETKDGCYRCLLAYNVSRDAQSIRRSEALFVLEAILERRGKLRAIESLDKVDLNPLYESELEKRFVEALIRYGQKSDKFDVKLEKALCDGKPGYILTVDGLRYEMTPQVKLEQRDGVSVPSRADFVIRSVRNQGGFKPIALFTDGFQYHGDYTTDVYRAPQDALQRMAIVRSGAWRCWSLSYDDVASVFEEEASDYWDALVDEAPGDVTESVPNVEVLQYPLLNAFELLIRLLARPDEKVWRALCVNVLMKSLSTNQIRGSDRESAELFEALNAGADSGRLDALKESLRARRVERPDRYLAVVRRNDFFSLVVVAKKADVGARAWENPDVALYLDDSSNAKVLPNGFRRAWNSWLNAYNLLQFLPQTTATTSRFALDGLSVPAQILEETPGGEWGEIFELADSNVEPLINLARERNVEPPEVGFELTNTQGTVVAQAELVWEVRRVAVLLNENAREAFEASGWQVVVTNDKDWVNRTLELLEGVNEQ